MRHLGIFFTTLFLLFFTFSEIKSQDTIPGNIAPFSVSSDDVQKSSPAAIYYYERDSNGLIIIPKIKYAPLSENVTFRDTMFFDPAFLPIVYDGKILPDNLNFLQNLKSKSNKLSPDFHLIDQDSTLTDIIARNKSLGNLRRKYSMEHPDLINYNASSFDKNIPVETKDGTTKSIFKQLISADGPSEISAPKELEKYVPKIKYWVVNGEHTLQLSQNKYSNNWYKGGNNNFNIQNYHKITANYKKNKLTFNNTFEWKLNLQNTPADTINNISITEDFFRIYSVLGLEAYKKWSYTANFEAKTPLFSSYPINSRAKSASFLSPLEINSGIGMSYTLDTKSKKDKYKNLKLSINLAPISVNYKYVRDSDVDETKSGIESGKKANTSFGSTVNTNLTYNYNRYVGLTSRLKYFSNYKSTLMESENRFTMNLNRFFSTSLYLYLRFDDSVSPSNKDSDLGYFQYNEIIGFGLNYKW